MDVTKRERRSAAERHLQELVGSTARAEQFYRDQVLDHLNDEMQAFVGRQTMAFLATADARGHCDCSLRAGPAGFVSVLDAHCLAFPEYRGNGVMASAANISDNAHAALLFVDFSQDVIGLHVNGRAELVAGRQMQELAPSLGEDQHRGRRPVLWTVVRVDEAYVHCSKHIPRLVPVRRQHRGTDDRRRRLLPRRGATPRRLTADPRARQGSSHEVGSAVDRPDSQRVCSFTVLRLRDDGASRPSRVSCVEAAGVGAPSRASSGPGRSSSSVSGTSPEGAGADPGGRSGAVDGAAGRTPVAAGAHYCCTSRSSASR